MQACPAVNPVLHAGTARAGMRGPHQNAISLHCPYRQVSYATSSMGSGGARSRPASATQPEPLDQGAVALHVDLCDVLQQATAPADQQQQPAPRVVVVFVHLQV